MKKSNVLFITQAAVIAGLYAVLTYVAAAMNLAYGAVQFRFSEALTILPVFTPAAIPGLAMGCFISNIASPLGVVDWIFGTLATLLSAVCSRAVRNIKFKDIPILAPIMPVLFNALIIGIEVAGLTDSGFSASGITFVSFLSSALSVGIGELVVCYALGIPLMIAIRKTKIEKALFSYN